MTGVPVGLQATRKKLFTTRAFGGRGRRRREKLESLCLVESLGMTLKFDMESLLLLAVILVRLGGVT